MLYPIELEVQIDDADRILIGTRGSVKVRQTLGLVRFTGGGNIFVGRGSTAIDPEPAIVQGDLNPLLR